ncbi:MAG: sensor histidine kinase, partial [Acidimicrobiales bacterium]
MLGAPEIAAIREHTVLLVLVAVAVVAAACLSLAVGLALSRRSVNRRLASLATRLGTEPLANAAGAVMIEVPHLDLPSDRGGLEAVLERLQQAAELATEAVTRAGEETVRLRRALDSMPQGVVVCGEDGRVRFRNARAMSLIGGRHGDLLAARALDDLLVESADGTSAERTLDLYGPPRRTLTVRTTAIDDDRRSLGVVAVLDDVSERRRLEAVRRDFVANVSHELKTPVGALGLLAETLAAETDQAVARRLADRIQAESFRVSRIIEDLLDLSRIEAQESPPREPTEVNLVMAEAIERVRQTAEACGVGLAMDEPRPPVAVLGDRRQLVSALHNLLENAIKYSDSGSQVELAGRPGPDWVDLVVRDHGVGIPARDLERVFERFYRVDQGRSRQTGGTGLGLAIVRHVAHNHGGRVWVESREGEGSTFTLRLPIAPPGPPAGA